MGGIGTVRSFITKSGPEPSFIGNQCIVSRLQCELNHEFVGRDGWLHGHLVSGWYEGVNQRIVFLTVIEEAICIAFWVDCAIINPVKKTTVRLIGH